MMDAESARRAYDGVASGAQKVAYYGTQISPNRVKTQEGFWIYTNVPIARTGKQEYQPRELGMDGHDLVPVFRAPADVFDPAAIASFEGKIVTDEHPMEMVTAENAGLLMKGVVKNVHQGDGEENDLLLADLVIYDPGLNEEIQQGKKEISSGYYHDLVEQDGNYYQRNIRGNHVAVVQAGKAGPRVSIKDSQNKTERGKEEMLEKAKKKGFVARLMGVASKDADPDELAGLIEEHMGNETPEAPEAPAPAEQEAADEGNEVMELLKQLAARLDALEAGNKPDALDELEGELTKDEDLPATDAPGDAPTDEEAVVVEAGDEGGMCQISRDAATSIIRAMRPTLNGIQDGNARKAAKDSLVKSIRGMMCAAKKRDGRGGSRPAAGRKRLYGKSYRCDGHW